MTEHFIAILEKENEEEFLDYLKSLTEEQKKKLIPQIKKLNKEYSQYGPLGDGRGYGHVKGTDVQRELLQTASFVCFNRLDYDKTPYSIWMLEKGKLSKIINWYCPSWFKDFVNQQATLEFIPYYLNYDWVMELSDRDFLNPSRELITKIIPQVIFELNKERNWEYKPEKLLKRKISLEEHIWYLFELESNIHYSERYLNFVPGVSKEKIGWLSLFKQYMNDGLINRSRLIKESLLASNRNFNKVLSGWFSQLFSELEPTNKEILSIQQELFSVLSSPHSKPVNTALQIIKNVLTEKDFTSGAFLDSVPMLLSSDTKATILSCLMILEKLAQLHPEHKEKIVLMVCQCFIHSDEAIQSKASKIVSKFGEPSNTDLRNELSTLFPSMLITARQTLPNFYNSPNSTENVSVNKEQHLYTSTIPGPLNEIPFPKSIDDLIFLASQAFDNNEPWHLDTLAAALVNFRSELTEDTIPQFEPAFQRAFGILKNGLRTTTGYLDQLLAIFFIDFGNWLIRTFPDFTQSLVKIYRIYDTKEDGKNTSYLVVPGVGSYCRHWEVYNKAAIYQPFKQILLLVLDKLKMNDPNPLLSTPTHGPCWISPVILIDRLITYQKEGKSPDIMDLQIAISRCSLTESKEALEKAKNELSGELKDLIYFLLDEEGSPTKPFQFKAAWRVASLTKKTKKAWPLLETFTYEKNIRLNYTGKLHWESKVESYLSNRYDYTLRKDVQVPATRKILSVYREHELHQKTGLKKLISKILPDSESSTTMLYDFLNFRLQYLNNEYNDIKRVLSLVPNNSEPILIDTLNQCLDQLDYFQESDKKMVTAILQMLHETWKESSEIINLFLGTCMLCSDKTIVNIAGEIWIKAVSNFSINNTELGKVIGLHERIEFAPLKRFTDLANQNLFRVSDLHNRELSILVENILLQLADEPIKNLKKLLEIYSELPKANLASNKLAGGLSERFEVWEKNAGLRKIVEILKL